MKYHLVTIDLLEADRVRFFGENPQPWQQPHSCRSMVWGYGWKVHNNHNEALAQAARFNREVLRGIQDAVWMVVLACDKSPKHGDLIDFPSPANLTREPIAPFSEATPVGWREVCHA